MAKKLDVTKPGSTGKANASKSAPIHPKGITAKHNQESAKQVGRPSPKLSPAYNLYKKFDY